MPDEREPGSTALDMVVEVSSRQSSSRSSSTKVDVEENVPASLICVVCFSLLATATSFNCGHVLCWKCADQWIGAEYETKGCPECRQPVGELRRCIAIDHMAAEVAGKWPAGSEKRDAWNEAVAAGLAAANAYTSRQAEKREEQALARLGIRRGWVGEAGRGLGPGGVLFDADRNTAVASRRMSADARAARGAGAGVPPGLMLTGASAYEFYSSSDSGEVWAGPLLFDVLPPSSCTALGPVSPPLPKQRCVGSGGRL